jgi:hypothetical protein
LTHTFEVEIAQIAFMLTNDAHRYSFLSMRKFHITDRRDNLCLEWRSAFKEGGAGQCGLKYQQSWLIFRSTVNSFFAY